MSNTRLENILKYTAIATGGIGLTGFAALKTHRLIKEAVFCRDEPKEVIRVRNRIHDKALRESAVERDREKSGEELQKQDLKTVECIARDGAVLIGHYMKHPDPKRLIIAFHGWRADWHRDFSPIWTFWQEACSVIFVEQRANGESGGEYLGYGTLERFDAVSWIERAKELTDWEKRKKETGKGLPLYLAGVSMGAATVLLASGLSLPEGVSGILADCGFTSMEAIWDTVMKNKFKLPAPVRAAELRYLRHCIRKTGGQLCSTLDAMDVCRTPVFFTHGAEDHFVPVSMTQENYERCKAPKKLYIGPDAGHGQCYYFNPEAYRKEQEEFFRECEA